MIVDEYKVVGLMILVTDKYLNAHLDSLVICVLNNGGAKELLVLQTNIEILISYIIKNIN